MDIERDVPLKDFTTFHIGGPARYFVRAAAVRDIENAYAFARQIGLPVFLLGGGSNVLIADDGFNGLVIKNEIPDISFENGSGGVVYAYAGAGEVWDTLVHEAARRNLSGIENLSAIPGTVGAAPVQNIGAYGVELADTLQWVEVFDTKTLTTQRLGNDECGFAYRDSIFKREDGAHLIITRVCLALAENGTPDVSYKDLAEHFSDATPTAQSVRNAVIGIRRKKFPPQSKIGTAGSFFKNPIVPKKAADRLKKKYPDLPLYKTNTAGKKASAAYLLEHAGGFRGVRREAVGTWDKHALVLVNYGGASAADVHALAKEMRECIQEKERITLEQEVRCVGACPCVLKEEASTRTNTKNKTHA